MREWLKNLRVKANMSQQQLAEKVEVSREYITMIENNERTPSVLIAKKIGKELNFNWTIFFESKSNKSTLKTG
jgi:transcriptional regulator with XRE-family HTH domain